MSGKTGLTYPMKLALRAVAEVDAAKAVSGDWLQVYGWVDRRSLPALHRRGLVKYAEHVNAVRLTDEGRSVALALYKHKGGAS